MIFEYAVNPSLCSDWQNLRMLFLSCGKEEGRLISDIPRKTWQSLAINAINQSDPKPVMRKRLKLFVRQIINKSFYVRNQTNNNGTDWISYALNTHRDWPFKAILSNDNPENQDCILCNDIELPFNEHWKASTSITVPRNPSDMLAAISPILENARQVMLVDRNFSLVDASSHPIIRFKSVLIEILEFLSSKKFGPAVGKITYHIGDHHYLKNELERQCNLYLKNQIPIGMKVDFCIWPKDDLHDRFVLTDIGGVDFGQGLDEYTGYGSKTVKISRLSFEDYKNWWSLCNQKVPDLTIIR